MWWFSRLSWGDSDLKGMFCFGSSLCWPRLSGFLDRPNEMGYTRMLKWLYHSLCPSFYLFLLFTRACHIFPLMWLLYLDYSRLHVHFLASEMFCQVFVLWDLTRSLSIVPNLLCIPIGGFEIFHLCEQFWCYVVYFTYKLFYHHPCKICFWN